jgi:hypothetical protein
LDYSIVAYLELNLSPNESEETQSPILFLPGNMHTVFLDQDSIGSFSVEETVVEKDKFFNLNEIFNGFDSTKKYNIGTFYEKRKIISAKSIEGNFKTFKFKILINYANNLKTIFISGYTEDDFRKNLGDDTNIHFLPKPFTLKDLAAKVKDVLSN